MEMEKFHGEGYLKHNPQALEKERRRDDDIAHVSSTFIREKGYENLAHVIELLRAVPFAIQQVSESNHLKTLEVPHEIMFASYKGSGALHQSHRDNYPKKGHPKDNGRVITAILYMNEDWREGFGGCLRLQTDDRIPLTDDIDMKQFDPWNKEVYESIYEFLDIPPAGGTLVIFNSRDIIHSVVPITEKSFNRYALTLWVTDEKKKSSFEYTRLKF